MKKLFRGKLRLRWRPRSAAQGERIKQERGGEGWREGRERRPEPTRAGAGPGRGAGRAGRYWPARPGVAPAPARRPPQELARAALCGQLPGGTWIAGRVRGAEPPAPRRGRGGAQRPVPRKVTQRAAPGLGEARSGVRGVYYPPGVWSRDDAGSGEMLSSPACLCLPGAGPARWLCYLGEFSFPP